MNQSRERERERNMCLKAITIEFKSVFMSRAGSYYFPMKRVNQIKREREKKILKQRMGRERVDDMLLKSRTQ